MTGGFATIAGGVLAAYIICGVSSFFFFFFFFFLSFFLFYSWTPADYFSRGQSLFNFLSHFIFHFVCLPNVIFL